MDTEGHQVHRRRDLREQHQHSVRRAESKARRSLVGGRWCCWSCKWNVAIVLWNSRWSCSGLGSRRCSAFKIGFLDLGSLTFPHGCVQSGTAPFSMGMVPGSLVKVLSMKSTTRAVLAEAMLLQVCEGNLQSPLRRIRRVLCRLLPPTAWGS